MKKISLILFLLCFSMVSFGQDKSYQGFYQAKFFDFFGDVKMMVADFEIKQDNSMVAKIKIGNEIKTLTGLVDKKGKFEAQSEKDGEVIYKLKGKIADKDNKVSFIRRTEQRASGSKSVSESGLEGSFAKVAPPVELKDVGIVDNGKTQLWFQHSNPIFGKEWINFPAIATIKETAGIKAIEVEMKLKTDEDERRFRFRMIIRQDGQKMWAGKDLAISSYAESKKSVADKSSLNFFMGSAGNVLGGQVEIMNENENEIVFKITNLQIKKTADEGSVQIDGYIYANKAK